jgi:hypothetical protein
MGAEVTYFVKVLKTVEALIEVDAVTGSEAMRKAEKEPGVIRALECYDHEIDAQRIR